MKIVDYLIIGLVDYILIGIFKVIMDFSGNPINRPAYTYSNPSLRNILLTVLTWPLSVCIEIYSEIRLKRIKRLIKSTFNYLFQIAGLVLWSFLAYLLAQKITQNYLFKIFLFLVILYFCLMFVLKMLTKSRPRTSQEEFLEIIKKYSKR